MVCCKNHEGPPSLLFILMTSSFDWADRHGKLHHMLAGVTSQQWQKWHYGVLYNTSHGTRPWTPLWAPVSNQACRCSRTEIASRGKVTLTLWKALTCTIASTYLTLAITGLLCRVLWLTFENHNDIRGLYNLWAMFQHFFIQRHTALIKQSPSCPSPFRLTCFHFKCDQSKVFDSDVSEQTGFETHRFHYGWETPLCAEQPLTVQASLFVDAPVQNIHSNHTGVHGVGVLLHGSLGHRLPRMAVEGKSKTKWHWSIATTHTIW